MHYASKAHISKQFPHHSLRYTQDDAVYTNTLVNLINMRGVYLLFTAFSFQHILLWVIQKPRRQDFGLFLTPLLLSCGQFYLRLILWRWKDKKAVQTDRLSERVCSDRQTIWNSLFVQTFWILFHAKSPSKWF